VANKRSIDNPYGKRNYRKEYDEYHGTREQKDNRNDRNKARRKVGLKKGDPREVDHKKPVSKGGSNGRSNLRAVSRTQNRKKYNGG
jgi:5-methylcytosine-specific restriction endonuclease McrA|tara:strand:+ start:773 stop:1030 length:258 start_codon:yes stop_codon:yes gene_type:complete